MVQAVIGDAPPVRVERVGGGNGQVVEDQPSIVDVGGSPNPVADRSEALILRERELHDQHREAALEPAQPGDGPSRQRVADEHLLAIQQEAIALANRCRTECSPVRRRPRLGDREGGEPLAACQTAGADGASARRCRTSRRGWRDRAPHAERTSPPPTRRRLPSGPRMAPTPPTTCRCRRTRLRPAGPSSRHPCAASRVVNTAAT